MNRRHDLIRRVCGGSRRGAIGGLAKLVIAGCVGLDVEVVLTVVARVAASAVAGQDHARWTSDARDAGHHVIGEVLVGSVPRDHTDMVVQTAARDRTQ